MDRVIWRATVCGVAKSQTQLSDFHSFTHSLTLLLLLLLSHFSRVQLCVTPQTVAYQAPLSLGFSRQEYCSGLEWVAISFSNA